MQSVTVNVNGQNTANQKTEIIRLNEKARQLYATYKKYTLRIKAPIG